MVKKLRAIPGDARDLVLIPGLGRSPGGGHGNPLEYPCLENLHEQRSRAGYSPWGHKESDMTEQLSTAQHIFKFNIYLNFKYNRRHYDLPALPFCPSPRRASLLRSCPDAGSRGM